MLAAMTDALRQGLADVGSGAAERAVKRVPPGRVLGRPQPAVLPALLGVGAGGVSGDARVHDAGPRAVRAGVADVRDTGTHGPGASDAAVARLSVCDYAGFLIESSLVGALGDL